MVPGMLQLLCTSITYFQNAGLWHVFALIAQFTLALDLASFWYAFLTSSAIRLALVVQCISKALILGNISSSDQTGPKIVILKMLAKDFAQKNLWSLIVT